MFTGYPVLRDENNEFGQNFKHLKVGVLCLQMLTNVPVIKKRIHDFILYLLLELS